MPRLPLSAMTPRRMDTAGSTVKVALEVTARRSFGDVMFTAMFIGLVSTYIGSYLGTWTSTGDFLPLAVAFVAGLAMAVFEYFARVKKVTWLDNFSMACSMLVGMGAAVLLGA